MIEAKIVCKIWDAAKKKTDKGREYLNVCLTDSVKDKTSGEWKSNYYYINVWGGEWYQSLVEQLTDGRIKTVKSFKGEATKMVFTCGVTAGKNYKTQEPELQFTFKSFEFYVDPNVKSTTAQPNYEAAKVPTEDAADDYETNPPW